MTITNTDAQGCEYEPWEKQALDDMAQVYQEMLKNLKDDEVFFDNYDVRKKNDEEVHEHIAFVSCFEEDIYILWQDDSTLEVEDFEDYIRSQWEKLPIGTFLLRFWGINYRTSYEYDEWDYKYSENFEIEHWSDLPFEEALKSIRPLKQQLQYKELKILQAKRIIKKLFERKQNYCAPCDVAERMRELVYLVTNGMMSYASYSYEAMEQVYYSQLEEQVERQTKELQELCDNKDLEIDEQQEELSQLKSEYKKTLKDLELIAKTPFYHTKSSSEHSLAHRILDRVEQALGVQNEPR